MDNKEFHLLLYQQLKTQMMIKALAKSILGQSDYSKFVEAQYEDRQDQLEAILSKDLSLQDHQEQLKALESLHGNPFED